MSLDQENVLTGRVIGGAIAVHRALGPGVDEAAYEEALSIKLRNLGLAHERQKPLPIFYKGLRLDCGYRLDLLVEGQLPVELKAVEITLPIHEAQLLTYMKMGGHQLGLLINFDVALLKDGVRRFVLSDPTADTTVPPRVLPDGLSDSSVELLTAAVEVHQALGAGLLRSAYEECLCMELIWRNIRFERRCHVPLRFEDQELLHGAKIPLVIEDKVPVYCVSVSHLAPVHEARVLACLSQTQWPCGFLVNFGNRSLEVRRLIR